MAKPSISDRTAWESLSPSSRGDWHRIRVVGGYMAVIAVFVATLFIFKHRHREHVVQNWKCATATVEDVRSKEIKQVSGARGVMLYQVSILAKYASGGTDH